MIFKKEEDYTFSAVCKRLSSPKYNKGELISDIKLFSELATCFFGGATTAAATGGIAAIASAPIVLPTTAIISVITFITQKGKILDAAKRIIELLHKGDPSYIDRYERMRDAYAILWVASFYDAFARTVPQSILKKITPNEAEKKILASQSYLSYSDPEINLPNLFFSIDKVYEQLSDVYSTMTQQLRLFIKDLAFSDEAHKNDLNELNKSLDNLPEEALNTFKDQYLTLCSYFVDFGAFICLEKEKEQNTRNIQTVSEIKELIEKRTENIQNPLAFSEMEELIELRTDDILRYSAHGFLKLEQFLLSLGETQREQAVKDITDQIREQYKSVIERPIVDTEDDNLVYPSVEQSFIPQHYQLQEYISQDMHLELESQWNDCHIHRDMSDFWIKYLFDSQSVTRLLLILGDPGSGKSRLTEIISAAFSSETELIIRIPLREYIYFIGKKDDKNKDYIETIICRRIEKDGDYANDIPSFKWFTGKNPLRPITLIFDGYDEIQQATGLPYSSFLSDLSEFQIHCAEKGRPVRIVITSRRTLIDKAYIPIRTIVMKLLPFDSSQKHNWINIWNNTNQFKFQAANIRKFELPESDEKIQDLASQPLLLLMLAIYDADFEKKQNTLQAAIAEMGETFNRARLYNDLIRRFIHRELKKGHSKKAKIYIESKDDKKEKLVDAEMEKLGIAALGMFIREQLWITISELDNDFNKLDADVAIVEDDKALDSGEIFTGSFFFIHGSDIPGIRDYKEKTKAISCNIYKNTEYDKNSSFVFLHKTFYEFLTANYILDKLFDRVICLSNIKKEEKCNYDNALVSNEQPLFISLNGSALCAEPVIITMIKEWWPQKASYRLKKKIDKLDEDIVTVIDDIIVANIQSIKSSTQTYSEDNSLLQNRPITQQIALYALNLITLIIILNENWIIDLDNWKFISQYIKLYSPTAQKRQRSSNDKKTLSNPQPETELKSSEELLLRFMALFQISSKNKYVIISERNTLLPISERSPLEKQIEIIRFLQDDISNKLYSLHNPKLSAKTKMKLINSLATFDQILVFEKHISELHMAISQGRAISNDEIYSYMSSFSKALQLNPHNTNRFISWMNAFQKVKTINPSFSLSMNTIALIIQELIMQYDSIGTPEAFTLLDMWINCYLQKMNLPIKLLLPTEEPPFDSSLSLPSIIKYPGSIAYKMVVHLEQEDITDTSQDYISNLYCEFTHLLSEQMHISPSQTNTYIHNGPMWIASMIKFFYIHDHTVTFQVISESIVSIIEYQNRINSEQVYQELPCLLGELAIIGLTDLVKKLLDNVVIRYEQVCSKHIYKYIAIADNIGYIVFLKKIYTIANSNVASSDMPYMIIKDHLSVYITYLILLHNDCSFFGQAQKLLLNESSFDYIFREDIILSTRLFTIVYQQNKSDNTKTFTYAQSVILDNINRVFLCSSQTAISFLHTVIPDQYNKIINVNICAAIQRLIHLAKLNEQFEEIEQLEELLKSCN